MRGAGSIFIKPREQMRLILPTLATVLSLAAVGYAVLAAQRYAAYHALEAQNVDERVLLDYVVASRTFLWIYGGVCAGVMLGGLLWAWSSMTRVLGPLARLERDLSSILRGEQKFLNLRTRKGDVLRPVLELFEQFLSRPRG